MASARLERTTAELADGTGQHGLRATGQVVLFPGFLALYEEGRDDAEDEDSAPPAAPARRRHAGQEIGRGRAAFHPAAAALFRGEPGQAHGGARHRPALDLRRDPADAEGPRLCPAREEPLLPRGERAAADRLPRALLRTLRLLRFHRPSRGRARRDFGRADAMAAGARGLLARFQAEDRRGDGAEALGDHRRVGRFPRALAVPGQRRRQRPAALPGLRRRPARPARRPLRRLRRLLQLSRLQVHPPLRPGRARAPAEIRGRSCSGRTRKPART